MATVRDLIRGSLRLIGAVATGETPSAEEQADALAVLNDMLDSWSIEGLIVYAKEREEFALVAGQSSYTMGSGGNFNTTRPFAIEKAGIEDSGGVETPIEIINQSQYADISLKSQSGSPSKLYPSGTHPLETLIVWPVPDTVKNLVLYSQKPITSFASVNTTVDLPPGYAKALRYGLAAELAPEYGKTLDQAIVIQMTEAKANIKSRNIRPVLMTSDAIGLSSARRSFNILTGE